MASCDTVYRQMRLATSVYSLLYALNMPCCSRSARSASGCGCMATMTASARWRWPRRWRHAPAGHVALDHVGTVGAVREHRHRARRHQLDLAAADGGRRPRAHRRCPPRRGEIRFDDVAFHYGKGGGVIEDLTCTSAPGEKIGLVGRSGAGKSTLVNLLLRFHDVEAGRDHHRRQDVASVRRIRCARRSAWSPRTPRCCTARCARTSSTAAPTPATRR
jgi:ATP-binding cassette subfamily B multidrug efflux pump